MHVHFTSRICNSESYQKKIPNHHPVHLTYRLDFEDCLFVKTKSTIVDFINNCGFYQQLWIFIHNC